MQWLTYNSNICIISEVSAFILQSIRALAHGTNEYLQNHEWCQQKLYSMAGFPCFLPKKYHDLHNQTCLMGFQKKSSNISVSPEHNSQIYLLFNEQTFSH